MCNLLQKKVYNCVKKTYICMEKSDTYDIKKI